MKILALDDSGPDLKLLAGVISEACPQSEIFTFDNQPELFKFAKNNICNIVFLDIKLWGMKGPEIAKELKKFNRKINIIFVTAYPEYAYEAFSLYPSGYVLKPVTKEAVEREIENLRFPVDLKTGAKIFAQTFGNFEVFSYGIALKFGYSKTRELLAYLIDRNGAVINMNELCAVLWENKEDTVNLKAYLRKLIGDLIKTLENAGADDIILKRYNGIAVKPEKIACDFYRLLKGDLQFANAYSGQYMVQYSWSEITSGILAKKL